jgi:hypothetical protein
MPRQKLTETLASLHAQLKGDAPLDDADRAHLMTVLDDIRHALESNGGSRSTTLGDRITETVARLEAEHPTIATALHETVELLKRL